METESIKAFCCPNSNKEVIDTKTNIMKILLCKVVSVNSNLLESKPNERIGIKKEYLKKIGL